MSLIRLASTGRTLSAVPNPAASNIFTLDRTAESGAFARQLKAHEVIVTLITVVEAAHEKRTKTPTTSCHGRRT
jgi:hypothetical protein